MERAFFYVKKISQFELKTTQIPGKPYQIFLRIEINLI